MIAISLPSWLTRLARWTLIGITTLLILALISWIAVPPLAKHIAEQQIEKQLGRKATIQQIHFNPFIFKLTVSGFTLYQPDRIHPALSADTLLLETSWSSLWHLAPVVNQIQLINPTVHLTRVNTQGIGRYDFSDILDKLQAMPPSPKNSKPIQFSLSNIQLVNGSIDFHDLVTHKDVNVQKLNIGIPFISNFPVDVDVFVQPHLSALINGTPFNLKGRAKPFSKALDTTLALDIDQLRVANYIPFSPVALPIAINSGDLTTKLDLNFNRNGKQPEIQLSGLVRLDQIDLTDSKSTPLAKAQRITAQIKKINLLNGDTTLQQLEVNQPEVWASMDAQGQLNWALLGRSHLASKTAKEPSETNKSTADAKAASENKAATEAKATTPIIIVDHLKIYDGIAHWQDAAFASPTANLTLNHIVLDTEHLTVAPKAPPAEVTLNIGDEQLNHIHFSGKVDPLEAAVTGQATVSGLALAQFQPYLNRSLNATINGQLSITSQLDIQKQAIDVNLTSLSIDDLKAQATKAQGNVPQLAVKQIQIENTHLNTAAHHVEIGNVLVNGIQTQVLRDAKGAINLQQFLVQSSKYQQTQAQGKTKPTPAGANNDWTALINQVAVSNSHVGFTDQSMTPAVQLNADQLSLTASHISSKLDQPIQIDLKTLINKSGKVGVNGTVAGGLKSVTLNIDSQNLPLVAVQPYYSPYLNFAIASGQGTVKGKLLLTPPIRNQKLHVNYSGLVALSNIRTLDKATSDDFVKWKALNIGGINVDIGGSKPIVKLGQIDLSDFYARLILSEQGKLNLEDIIASDHSGDAKPTSLTQAGPSISLNGKPPADTTASTPATSTPQTTASAASPPAVTPNTNAPNPSISIGKVTLKRGNINYTDNFVKPHYSANVTSVNGSIGAISSDKPAPAPLDLTGKLDSDAPVYVSGSLNPLFKPMFLDIKASASGVDLPKLTPYSAKYAGYAIDKGKLSMDVTYHIEKDQLLAQNHINIDQLTFGDHIDSPTATKLPVRLAVALLKDRHGQIDINLPISGSLSDPQFSVGGVILKVFINLITKAVTSPFALIGSMFGGGDELGYAEFPTGSATLTADAQKKLDTIAKALTERPALKMDLIGRVDPVSDADGIRELIIDSKINALKNKDSVNLGVDSNPDNISITQADKDKYMSKLYSASHFDKPKNFIGLSKSLPTAEMEKLIKANTPVNQDALSALANRRAEAVRQYLETHDQITSDRLFLVAPKLTTDGITDKGTPNRVDFALK